MYRHVSRMNRLIKTAGAEYITSLPSPVAVIDENNNIVWYNEFFREKVAIEREAFGLNLPDCISIDILAVSNRLLRKVHLPFQSRKIIYDGLLCHNQPLIS